MEIEEYHCRPVVFEFVMYDLFKFLGRHIHLFLSWSGSGNSGTSHLWKDDLYRLSLDISVLEDKHGKFKEQNGIISKIKFSPSATGSISDQALSFYGASSDEEEYQLDL